MKTSLLIFRLLALILVYVASSMTEQVVVWPGVVCVAIYGVLLFFSGWAYLRTIAGKLELVGGVVFAAAFGCTALLIKLNQSEELGVIVWGMLGLFFLSAVALCGVGAIMGLIQIRKSTNARPEPPK